MAKKPPPPGDQPWYTFPTWFKYHDKEGGGGVETGVDFLTPFHWRITELFGGKVVNAGYHDWGGEVDVQTDVPLFGPYLESYVHLDRISPNIKPGKTVQPGDVIGLSGGENPGFPGAEHPALPQYSSKIHTEYDLWKGSTPWHSPSDDPLPIMSALWTQLPGSPGGSPPWGFPGGSSSSSGSSNAISDAIGAIWNSIIGGFGVADGKDLVWRAGFIVVGLILTIIGVVMFLRPEQHAAEAVQLITKAAVGGA